MERRRMYVIIAILIALVLIVPTIYERASEKAEARNLSQATSYLESFGWQNEFMTSADILIDDKASEDLVDFKYRKAASQDIGLNYLTFEGKEVRLYAFKVDKKYKDKPVYAHVLIFKGQVIGAYLQSKSDYLDGIDVFSLRDRELNHPNLE